MEGNEHTLEFNLEEYLLMGISVLQLEDETKFYWNNNCTSSKRLYAKKNGKEIVAELPGDKCDCLGVYGDAVFLRSNEKIYKARIALPDNSSASFASTFYYMFFPESARIEVSYVRDVLRDEFVNRNGMCSRTVGGKEYVYRVGDDPERDWLLVDAEDKNLSQNLKLTCIHRNRAVYISYKSSKIRPYVWELGKNAIEIEIFHSSSNHINVFANDSSPFIYLAHDTVLHTIDTDTMQFLPDLQTNRVSIVAITGVQDRVITAQCNWDFDSFIATAQLPRGYYKNVAMIDELKVNMEEMSRRTDEIERKLREVCERNRELEKKDRQNEMIKTDLLDTIDELRKQSSIVPPDESETLAASSLPDTATSAIPTDPVMNPPPPPPPLPPNLNSLVRKASPTTSPSPSAKTPGRPSTIPVVNDSQTSLIDELRKRQEKMKEPQALKEQVTSLANSSRATVEDIPSTPSTARRLPPPVPPKPSRIPLATPPQIAPSIPINTPSGITTQHEHSPDQIGQGADRHFSEDDLTPPPAHILAASPCSEPDQMIPPPPVVSAPGIPPAPPPPIVFSAPPSPPSADRSNDPRSNLLEEIREGKPLKKATPNVRRNSFADALQKQFENLYPKEETEDTEGTVNDSWIDESVH